MIPPSLKFSFQAPRTSSHDIFVVHKAMVLFQYLSLGSPLVKVRLDRYTVLPALAVLAALAALAALVQSSLP